MRRSADDAGLPTDPEWRAAFVAYLEWGSRIALENSQPGAQPPPHMPVPQWSWVANATPGSRVSALAEQPAQQHADLPGPDEELSFAQHVKPLFRERDRGSMRFAFDLWSHDDGRPRRRDSRSAARGDDVVRRSLAGGQGGRPRELDRLGEGCVNGAKGEAVADEPTIHRFPAEHEGAFVNAYLVESDAGVVAVDGLPTVSAAKEMRIALDRLGSRFTRCW